MDVSGLRKSHVDHLNECNLSCDSLTIGSDTEIDIDVLSPSNSTDDDDPDITYHAPEQLSTDQFECRNGFIQSMFIT